MSDDVVEADEGPLCYLCFGHDNRLIGELVHGVYLLFGWGMQDGYFIAVEPCHRGDVVVKFAVPPRPDPFCKWDDDAINALEPPLADEIVNWSDDAETSIRVEF